VSEINVGVTTTVITARRGDEAEVGDFINPSIETIASLAGPGVDGRWTSSKTACRLARLT
jgi:hypothetical protein